MIEPVLREIPCNLCGSVDAEVVYPSTIITDDGVDFECACTCDGHGRYYRLVRCRHCGLLYSSPRPTGDILQQGYSDVEDAVYREEMEGRVKTFQRNLRNISQHKKKGQLLDVGCSMGVFLSEAREAGWDTIGIEPSSWCVRQGQELFNLDIRQGTSDILPSLNQKFDVVTLWDVLEHVDDPLRTLKGCRDVLKEDGLLVFSTVDSGSFYARLLGRKWPWLMKMHIYYFDRETIKEYLEKSGLELLDIKVYKHIVSLNYLLYKLKKINVFLYEVMRLIQKYIFIGRNIYFGIAFGDFMEVHARIRKTGASVSGGGFLNG